MVGLCEICVEQIVSGFTEIALGLSAGLVETCTKECIGLFEQSWICPGGWATLMGK